MTPALNLVEKFFRFDSQFRCKRLLNAGEGMNFPGKSLRAECPFLELIHEPVDVFVKAVIHGRILAQQDCGIHLPQDRRDQSHRISK